MHWLKTPEERVGSIEDPNTPIGKALMFLGDMRATITGRPMNDGAALSLAAFYNGVAIIAGDLATIPLKLYRKLDDGGRAEEMGHPVASLIELEPYPMITSSAWREASQGHLLLRGNTYTEIQSDSRGRITGLMPLNPKDVSRKGEVYEIGRGMNKRFLHSSEMLHVPGPGGNGIDGWSVITLARENLSLAQALEESNTRYIANASRPSGFISSPHPMTPEGAMNLKKEWAKANSGVDKVGNVPVLDNGMVWQQVGLSAEDAQYIESRKFSVTDVARWLNITPHKIKDLERATFSNVEELQIDHVRSTLRPWCVRWQHGMNTKLLTQAERRAGLFIAFNLDGLLQGDTESRSQAQRSYFEVGGLTTNEIRAMENRNPIPGGDRAFVRMDMMPLDRVDEIQSVETDAEGRTTVVFRGREERTREYRDHRHRVGLRDAFLALFLDAALRMIRGESRNIRRILERAEDLRLAITRYYLEDHPVFAHGVMSPVFRSYAESVSSAAASEIDSDVSIDVVTYADAYGETFANRYSASSRRALADLEAPQIETKLNEWRTGSASAEPRHVGVAGREVVKLADAVTRATWIAGGITTLVWRTISDSCPYCSRLNGKVVGIYDPFIGAREEFAGEGTDVPLVPKSDVSHAPAHRGCDCTIVPGR